MPSLFILLRVGHRIVTYNEAGNAELLDNDKQRDEDRNLVVTDLVLIPNQFGGDEICDDLRVHFRKQPVNALPVATSCAIDHNFLPAVMEQVSGSPVKVVA